MEDRKYIGSRRPLLALLIAAMLLVPAVVLIGGCGGDEKTAEEVINKAADEVQKAIDDGTAHTVTVTGFTCPIPADDATGEAEAGNVFASVNVKIKNDSDNEILVSSASFSLEDEDGSVYESSILYDGPNAIGVADNIAPGGELEGILVFEVPSDSKPKVLVEDSLVGDPIRKDLPEPS